MMVLLMTYPTLLQQPYKILQIKLLHCLQDILGMLKIQLQMKNLDTTKLTILTFSTQCRSYISSR